MALLARVIGTEKPKIPIHSFMAALAEYKRGAATKNQIVAFFGLSAGEATTLQNFLDNLDGNSIDRALLHDVLLLGEAGAYNEATIKSRLGLT